MWHRGKFTAVVVVIQVVFIIIYAFYVEYDADADAANPKHSRDPKKGGEDPKDNSLEHYYPMFQDVNVMIFIGFGFLMTFLKRYGYGAVGLNFLLASIAVQWAIIMQSFWDAHDGKIHIHITKMINADFASATVLISYGALLGKASPLQLVVMSIIEITIFACNEHLGVEIFQAADIGGSMFLHTFGAYFGLAVTFVLYRKEFRDHDKEGAVYHSDVFAMIGTVFLWMFWPSFNAAMGEGNFRHRAVINTYLSLSACCLATFAVSAMVDGKSRLNMVHVQNATLAGGVAIGTTADMMTHPFGAMLIGASAGILSTLGYHFLTPRLARFCRVHDTCGVNNLHGMPGIFAGLLGAILAYRASEDDYGKTLYLLFPARSPLENTTELFYLQSELSSIEAGLGRSASTQAAYQLVALGVTMLVAIGGGLVTGLILRLPVFEPPSYDQLFDDTDYWEVPEEAETEVKPYFNRKDEDTKDHLMGSQYEPSLQKYSPSTSVAQ